MQDVLENKIDELQDRKIADRNMVDRTKDIPGWGMDEDPENDPTYPMKHWNGADHERFNYEKAPQQPIDMEILHSIERPNVTRVAPKNQAKRAAISPIGPAPNTTTVSPFRMPPCSAAW